MPKYCKHVLLAILAFGLTLLLAACRGQQAEPEILTGEDLVVEEDVVEPDPVAVRVASLKGATGVGMVQIMAISAAQQDGYYTLPENAAEALANYWAPEQNLSSLRRSYSFALVDTSAEVVDLITRGDVDIAAMPTSLAADLYNRSEGSVQMIAINTYGTLYIIENGLDNDYPVQGWEDLRGQTIEAAGQGANAEFILNYLLTANGLTPGEDVTVEFRAGEAELATLVAGNQVTLSMLSEPQAATVMLQNEELTIAFDLTREWQRLGQGELAMSCVVARREFVEEHPEMVVAFLYDLRSSVRFASIEVETAAQLAAQFGLMASAEIAAQAIPNCNLTLVTGIALQTTIEDYYRMLYAADPQSIGGALPDRDFYHEPDFAQYVAEPEPEPEPDPEAELEPDAADPADPAAAADEA